MLEKAMLMEEIHESLVNGNRAQMVEQIDEYGLYEFWSNYKHYLTGLYNETLARYDYFTDATVSYFRIKNR